MMHASFCWFSGGSSIGLVCVVIAMNVGLDAKACARAEFVYVCVCVNIKLH